MGITLREAKFLEGDLILIKEGSIFDVKGLIHPLNKVVAFPRFIPDPSGDREYRGYKYRKIYNISVRFEFIEQNFPQFMVYDAIFDEKLCEVPLERVKHHYKPTNCLRELRYCTRLGDLEKDAFSFVELLRGCRNMTWSTIGISGSLLVKLHTPDSDIDPIIYGSGNCRKVYEALKSLTQDSKTDVKPYTIGELKQLFLFRVKDTWMAFKDFEKTESRKVLQGKFKSRDFFIRCVKDWSEVNTEYGAICYKNVGYAKIKAVIEDDSEAIFTPCSYTIRNVNALEGPKFAIEEIASFRGRFCEQARIGEVVIAQGKVEKVMDNSQNREYFRLLLGNRPSDFMMLA
jgi:predicted nucleotidyltransferase